MAVMMVMRWPGVTSDQYDRAREMVGWERDPALGGMFHVAAFGSDGLHVTDIWESPESFQRFTEERLMPAVAQIGIEGEPSVEFHQVHAVWTPDADRVAALTN
jgi:hypothetical protein